MITAYLTVDQVKRIHARSINRYGGAHGIRDPNALESALGRLSSGYYCDLIQEAAALLESLAINHPFADGNKRVAFLAADAFLALNGYYIDCDQIESELFVISVVENRENRFDRICDWLTLHNKPRFG